MPPVSRHPLRVVFWLILTLGGATWSVPPRDESPSWVAVVVLVVGALGHYGALLRWFGADESDPTGPSSRR